MRKLTADWIYPVEGEPRQDSVLVIDDEDRILDIRPTSEFDPKDLDTYTGCLVPGFVNAHCHLELSHMKGKVPTGTGLIPFIKSVVTKRDAEFSEIQAAIEEAEDEMIREGIVAVGDISNTIHTFDQKRKNRLRYYTFVEMFDFLQDADADMHFSDYDAVYQQLQIPDGHNKIRVPHAPYSVSGTLFARLRKVHLDREGTVSMHNQEMIHENLLFLNKSGDLIPFYNSFGVDLEDFEPTGQTSIYHALPYLDRDKRWLFVHNTLTRVEEIQYVQSLNDRVYWATCPNANLYIENALPEYSAFLEAGANVCIGTDSLTSNWALSIFSEIKTILKYQSYLDFDTVLQWATLNGARALGFESELGSFTPGKKPGVNQLSFDPALGYPDDKAHVRKLV